MSTHEAGGTRESPLAIDEKQFRALGHTLVDRIASWQATLAQQPVSRGEPADLRALLGARDGGLPASGACVQALLDDTTRLLLDRSPPSHHPQLHGYITAAPAPIGVLAELLAAALNANVALWHAAPLAAEIETQTVRWLAELVGYTTSTSGVGGLLTSGGTQANAMALQLALTARIPDWRERGAGSAALAVYASDQTHGWLPQAVEQAGLGRQAVRSIASDARQRIDGAALDARITADIAAGVQPLMVVGNAGTVGTGAVDPLRALAALCRERGLWFHIDGAYGAAAACLVGSSRESLLGDAAADLAALSEADSLSLDPHKWLYAPIEAGCLLVREPQRLAETFGDEPSYYGAPRADEGTSFHRLGPQNTRGFRALKVWLALRMAGRDGYRQMIGDDIALARRLFEQVARTPRLQALTQQLSITSFRYLPCGSAGVADDVNRALLARWQRDGQARLSPVTIAGRPALRACIVNHQTTAADVDAVAAMVVALGDATLGER